MAHKLRMGAVMPPARRRPSLDNAPDVSSATVARGELVLDAALDGVLIVGRDGLIRYINPAYCALLEYPHDELLGQPLSVAWSEPASLTDAQAALDDIVAEGGRVRFETLHRCKGGQRVWVEASVAELPEHGELVVSVRDISERKRGEQLVAAAEKLRAILETTRDGFCTLDRSGVIRSVNDTYCAMTGYSEQEIVGNSIAQFEVSSHHTSAVETHLGTVAAGAGHAYFESEHRHKDGHRSSFEVDLSWLPAYHEFVAFFRDITERKSRDEANRQAAFIDPLTQLPNRRMLIDRFPQAASRTARQGTHGALLFLDLDRFKVLNDAMGHDAGDALLCEVARRLTNVVRVEDAVVRLGGDEFVVLIEDLPPLAPEATSRALVLAERVRDSLADAYRLGAHVHQGGCSVGLALFQGASEPLDEVLRRADAAMYRAKQAGGCTVRTCDAGI